MTAAKSTPRLAHQGNDELGEGPVWDTRAEVLLRVDIGAGRALAWDPASDASHALARGPEVSAVLPRSAGGWVLAAGHDLLLLDTIGAPTALLATLPGESVDNRLNDCACDPQGRLWAGTMSREYAPGTAALYRVDADKRVERMLAGTTISNGLGWSPDGHRMYFVDSPTQRVDALDFDPATGTLGERRTFATIDPRDGMPDGLTVDAEGGVWVCLFGGGAIRRYDERGRLDAIVQLPVTNPTSATFGGAELRTLYITSARRRLTPAQLEQEPSAGAVLALEPGVHGLAVTPFAG